MSELTREQVEEVFNAVYWHGDQQGAKQCKVLDGIDALRATIEQQAQEITRLEGLCTERLAQGQHLHDQLAASQARCREMEAKVTVHTDRYAVPLEWTSGNKTEKGFITSPEHAIAIKAAMAELAQLQATLAAREARIDELEDWQKIVIGSGTDQETVIRMAANEYTKTAVQCWKDHTKKIEAERDAAVQEVGRLQLTWTTARPTVVGWYWWHHGGAKTLRYVHCVTQAVPPILRVECPDGWFEDIDKVDGEWAGPIPLPTEAQQARGSSGGAANQGAGE